MKKAKKKGKAAGKSKGKKSTKSKKAKSPAEVRQDISKLVSQHAMVMAKAIIGEGEKGQLAPTKYMWELAGVFPTPTDGGVPTEHEESLAETLFRKLNVPTTPVKLDEEDEDAVVVIAPRAAGVSEDNDHSGARTSAGGKDPEPVRAQRTSAESAEGTQGPSAVDAEKTQGPSTACIGSLCSPMHSGRDDKECFTPERTEEERVVAGEPSGV